MARLVLVFADDTLKEQVEIVLREAGAAGYTEISPAVGVGATGSRLGSGAFPGSSAVILSVMAPEVHARAVPRLAELCRRADQRVRAVTWEVEEIA